MKAKLFAVVALSFVMAGCGGKTPTQKEAAVKQWSQARAAVTGSLAKSQYEAGNFEKARQSIDEALKLDPENVNLHLLSVRLYIETGQLESALKEIDQIRKLDEKNAEVEYLAGVIYQRWQKHELAYQHYTKACEKNDKELAYVLARAETLVMLDRQEEALGILRDKLTVFEHNAAIHHSIGQILVDMKKYPQAVDSLRQAVMLAPEDANIREHLAMALFYNRKYKEAGDMFARLVRDPANAKRAELFVALGECQLQTGRVNDARMSFETAAELNPSSTTAWLSIAKVALQLNDNRRAETVLRKVIALDGGSAEGHLMLGYLRLKQNKLDQAMSEFQKASALDRTDPVSLCMIGYVYEKTGKPGQATAYYARALKVKPGDELATKLLASVDEN
jgi:tetratricopeptide (TPR) repeat protein